MLSNAEQSVFRSFCGEGKVDMGGKSFAKLCKSCHLLDRNFSSVDADLVFAMTVPIGLRRMDLGHFACALAHVATKRNISLCVVQEAVAGYNPPVRHAVEDEAIQQQVRQDLLRWARVRNSAHSASLGNLHGGSGFEAARKLRRAGSDGASVSSSSLSPDFAAAAGKAFVLFPASRVDMDGAKTFVKLPALHGAKSDAVIGLRGGGRAYMGIRHTFA
jgi:hypothetical protein